MTATPSEKQAKNIDFLLSLGELFTLVVYGQLIIEKSNMENVENDLLDQIFDVLVRDFSKYALQLYSKTSSTEKQMALCIQMIKKPLTNEERFQKIWWNYIYSLKDNYEMSP